MLGMCAYVAWLCSGPMPESLGQLKGLEVLNLRWNELTGTRDIAHKLAFSRSHLIMVMASVCREYT